MKNKKKKGIIIVFIIIVVLVSAFFGTLYYITSTVNNYSYTEKKWINENKENLYEIYVEKSLPVFSNEGKGVFYDYVSELKANTGLNLNVTTTEVTNIKLITINPFLSPR